MTHEAGWAHAPGALRGPAWLQPARATPTRWSRTSGRLTAHKNDAGELTVGGLSLPELVADVNTPAYVLDEADFRARARAFKDGFKDYDVFYAGKAFLCTTVAQWVAEEGLNLDVCSAGELTVALRAGFDPKRIGYHGNNKTHAELRRAVHEGVGRIVLDSFVEIERLAQITAELGRDPAGDGARDRRRRGAHPRVHRHRARGPEVRPLDHQSATPGRPYAACSPHPGSSCSACTATSAARSSTRPASRSRPAGCSRCTPGSPTSSA